ncbi:unnamed protein product, partial [Rotaria socialis]
MPVNNALYEQISDDEIDFNHLVKPNEFGCAPVNNNALYEQISDDEIDFNHLVKPNEFGCAPVNNDALNNNEFVVN